MTVGDRITRSVRAQSAATEQIPLVVRFDWARQLDPALRPASTITYPGRRMYILTVPHNGTFTLTITAR